MVICLVTIERYIGAEKNDLSPIVTLTTVVASLWLHGQNLGAWQLYL